ncbi:MAG TPA: phage N-6-adenine-methyltransferase [Devosia sp.]|nr:phage N-6-adenine-methyltransferase [Devosia sp.]
MIAKALYSSKNDDWGTPQDLFDRLNSIYNFQLDAAAASHNAKCPRFFTPHDDALQKNWAQYKRIWLNPPYGRSIGDWMKKAYDESQRGALVVCLVHARTDTRWWHNWVEGKARVTFLKGRLKFTTGKDQHIAQSAPFPSVLVVYDPQLYTVVHPSCNAGAPRICPDTERHRLRPIP